MGKSSPAKWIKWVLSGKKGSKPKVAKGDEKAAKEKEVLAVGNKTERNLAAATIASHLSDADSIHESLEMDKENESSPQNATIPESKLEVMGLLVALDGPEKRELDQHAIKVQASFRGYLARRAYLALKGIIKLQALIRGHLARRQAVSTIHCMLGIVKLQAHVRGKRVRISDIGLEVQGKVIFGTIWESKLVIAGEGKYVLAKSSSANVFIRKFLILSPKPLYVQYDSANPNSVTSWLDRWSISNFWKQFPRKHNDSNALDHNPSAQGVKTEMSMAKRNSKISSARADNNSTRSPLEVDRSRRTFRKPSIHSIEVSDPEAAKSELEKVKRSLRKVHESAFPSAAEYDNPKQSQENIFNNSGQNIPKPTKSVVSEKITQDPYDILPTLVDVEMNAEKQHGKDASDKLLDVQTNSGAKPLDNVIDEIPVDNKDSAVKQDVLDNKNQSISIEGSLQAKLESVPNSSNKQPKVPSYMLATKSAKAKLRDGSSLFEQDAPEKSLSTKRHSLPSTTGTKASSSPKTQKLIPSSNGKAKNKSVKSLTASKDITGKSDWRR